MTLQYEDLPTWSFDVQEVSAGVYRASGHDGAGHRFSYVGVDPEALLEECRKAARRAEQVGKLGSEQHE